MLFCIKGDESVSSMNTSKEFGPSYKSGFDYERMLKKIGEKRIIDKLINNFIDQVFPKSIEKIDQIIKSNPPELVNFLRKDNYLVALKYLGFSETEPNTYLDALKKLKQESTKENIETLLKSYLILLEKTMVFNEDLERWCGKRLYDGIISRKTKETVI